MNRPVSDIERVQKELAAAIDGEVRFDDSSRALYATDASNYRHVPIGVVVPSSVDDVVATVATCHRHKLPILPRGAGTSLCGQACNTAVVIDFTPKLNRILALDPEAKTASVEPGVVLDDLRGRARDHGLTFAPDPATHNHNTLGGMIGNNSCGPHSVMGGTTLDNVISLEILTSDGARFHVGPTDDDHYQQILSEGGRRAEIYAALRALSDDCADEVRRRFPRLRRRVSGYNLQALLPENEFNLAQALVGTEGTCAIVLNATVRLLSEPPARALLVLGYPSIYEAADQIAEVLQYQPIAVEGVDNRLVEDMKRNGLHSDGIELLPRGKGWLLVEFGGDSDREAKTKAKRLMNQLAPRAGAPGMRLLDDPDPARKIWTVREAGLGATAHVPGEPLTWEGWEDSAVPPQHLGEYLRRLRELFRKFDYHGDFYGHFGEGCVHTRIDFKLTSAAGIRRFRRFVEAAARLAVSFGGSISGEHGDGQSKAELLPLMYGATVVEHFGRFKRIWDPDGLMNPGRVVDPRPLDQDLRLSSSYRPAELRTRLHYPEDDGDFARAALRCVGVGECRKQDGTMCPSFMATGEEMHSTRGRAHLLHEMAVGSVLAGGWNETAVKQALELCLSCKACKSECPVAVDMAVYKAEFMHHYHRRRRRPLFAHAFGRIDRVARLASRMPRVVNSLSSTRPVKWLARRVLQLSDQRQLPRFAVQTLDDHARTRTAASAACPEVILWPDTFSNYFQPEVGRAAIRVLEACGWRVRIPDSPLCCGRPLYEFGLLDQAESYLRTVIDHLADDLVAGTPIVVLEPACLSVFKEELPRLLPNDQHARRLRDNAVAFDHFIERRWRGSSTVSSGRVLHHPHCHQRSISGAEPGPRLLRQLGFEVEQPDTGCCGMAGAFGFHRQHYEVSMRCAERVLLPSIAKTGADDFILSDGYSCREQIRHGSGRSAVHLAQLLDQVMHAKEQT